MSKVKDMTVEELEQFIEHKMIEVLGDPDAGLQLKKEFKAKLDKRLKKPSPRVSHDEVLRRFV